jgi:ATP-binding cassette subfamily B protein
MNALKRMLPFVQPYRVVVVFLVITVILPVTMELMVPRALHYVIDEGIQAGDMTAIVQGSLFMLGTALISAAATLGQGICRAQLSQGLAYDMRNGLFKHINTLSFANLDHMQTGELMTRLSSDVDLVRMFVSTGLALLLRALLMVGGSLLMMIIIDWQLALIMMTLLPLAALLIWSVMRVARPLFTIVQSKLGALNTIVQENLAGVQVVKAFVRERFEIERFHDFNIDYTQESIRVGRLLAVAMPLLMVLTNVGIVAVIMLGGRSTIIDRLTVGELVAFNNYLLIGMAPLLLLGNILTMVSRAEASAERVWEVLDTKPALQVAQRPHVSEVLNGSVVFKDVSFFYDGVGAHDTVELAVGDRERGENVLNGISFTVEAGQRVALLGTTGSGKTSLVNLIPRFYDSINGHIQIDGVSVHEWELEALRSQIGVVMQATTLFSGTVRENIAFGRPEASLDEVIFAATAAQAHEFITNLPSGYESWVEERGANFSGGQKQRIAIARALLINPRILILDDSTSAVDMETEARIQGCLDEMKGHLTTFIVAQRISSVLSADQILILDNGRLTALGTHQQLLDSSPIYQEIYRSQLGNGGEPQ